MTQPSKTPQPMGITEHDEPVRALIIDEPWISLILAGEKTWEMRTSTTHIRGPIGLIRKGSGLVVGWARVVDSLGPFDRAAMLANGQRHRIDADLVTSGKVDKWRHAWVLRDAIALHVPVPYQHRSGAVIWVELSPEVSRRIVAQLGG